MTAPDRSHEPDAVDPAQGVINWFAALMAGVLLVSISGAALVVWGLWHLARRLFGG